MSAMISTRGGFSNDTNGSVSQRPKLGNGSPHDVQPATLDLSAWDLQILLAFTQERGQEQRSNLHKFQAFLEIIQKIDSPVSRLQKVSVLLEYLRRVVPGVSDTSGIALPDVMQTWRFAVQTNNDGLSASVVSMLAQLLKLMSTGIEFRELGTRICQTLLLDDQIKLFDKGLWASRRDGPLLSACLRLLTEIVSFDGGVCAKTLFRQRHVLFKRLDELLSLRSGNKDKSRNMHASSIRALAIQFLLANLRVQDVGAKTEIMGEQRRVQALFNNLPNDPPDLVVAVMQTISNTIVSDSAVSRKTRSRILRESTLAKISALDIYDERDTDRQMEAAKVAHEFLLKVCCTPDAGVLLLDEGFYPPNANEEVNQRHIHAPSYPVKRQPWIEYTKGVPVRNTKLAYFIQELRPYANVRHCELMLAIFGSAHELVADYFLRKQSFSFDPKLSSTWVGYASFILCTLELPFPSFAPDKSLPAPSIVLENVMPSPLNRRSLTRCLNQSSAFVKMLTVKVLIAAFTRFETALKTFRAVSTDTEDLSFESWISTLNKGIAERCPELSTLITAFRTCSSDHKLLRESLLQLLALVSRTLPEALAQAKFDASVLLADALTTTNGLLSRKKLSSLELDHILEIATTSDDMDWWHKPEGQLTPFTRVLCVCLDRGGQAVPLLETVSYESLLLQSASRVSAFSALLECLKGSQASDPVIAFLDECFVRLVRRPVKYEGDLEALTGRIDVLLSLLTMVIVEQWPHLLKRASRNEVVNIATVIVRWLAVSKYIGETQLALERVQESLVAVLATAIQEEVSSELLESGQNVIGIIKNELINQVFDASRLYENKSRVEHGEVPREGLPTDVVAATTEELNALLTIPKEPDDYPQLYRWAKKTVVDCIEDGDISALIMCLCASDRGIRKQCLSQLRRLATIVHTSNYASKTQIHLLVMEVIETAAQDGVDDRPLPTVACKLASKAVHVLHDPLHFMYPKLNKFLLREPEWTVGKLPAYWTTNVLNKAPTDDNKHWDEVRWVLDILIDGLKTLVDFNNYRRGEVVQRFCAAYTTLPDSLKSKVIHLIWRATFIKDGSSTLVTRLGILAWCNNHVAKDNRFQALRLRILQTCDKAKIDQWSSSGAKILDASPRERPS